jgi:uncharacterized damage-inducible protein DinB
MEMSKVYVQEIVASKDYFDRSTRVLVESDSTYRPTPEMMTAAQQVGHVAQTLDWFVDGVQRPEGFDLNFEEHAKALVGLTSLAEARKMLDAAFAKAIAFLGSCGDEQFAKPLPEGPVMGGQPMSEVVWAMVEHTAHHRGALTVYSRMLGKVPAMPYGEMPG